MDLLELLDHQGKIRLNVLKLLWSDDGAKDPLQKSGLQPYERQLERHGKHTANERAMLRNLMDAFTLVSLRVISRPSRVNRIHRGRSFECSAQSISSNIYLLIKQTHLHWVRDLIKPFVLEGEREI